MNVNLTDNVLMNTNVAYDCMTISHVLYISLDLRADPIFLWAIYVCVSLAFMYSASHIAEYLL